MKFLLAAPVLLALVQVAYSKTYATIYDGYNFSGNNAAITDTRCIHVTPRQSIKVHSGSCAIYTVIGCAGALIHGNIKSSYQTNKAFRSIRCKD
ncbi:hypothetical protein K7432_015637 [Basidiobolus ranarum]|uniref:Uncharacterized protein n=1 Tax=Basidiobolus ranarum TaxID=34480 RepID=A0ABR2VN05_9FUNG